MLEDVAAAEAEGQARADAVKAEALASARVCCCCCCLRLLLGVCPRRRCMCLQQTSVPNHACACLLVRPAVAWGVGCHRLRIEEAHGVQVEARGSFLWHGLRLCASCRILCSMHWAVTELC